MLLTKSKMSSSLGINFYIPTESIRLQTRVAGTTTIPMESEINEQVVLKTKSSIAFDFLGLFNKTTTKSIPIVIDKTIRKKKCEVTNQMRDIEGALTMTLLQMNPAKRVICSRTILGKDKDSLVKGQNITVSPRINELENEFIINWILTNTN